MVGRRAADVPDPGMNTATLPVISNMPRTSAWNTCIDDGWYEGSFGDGQWNSEADVTRPAATVELRALLEHAR